MLVISVRDCQRQLNACIDILKMILVEGYLDSHYCHCIQLDTGGNTVLSEVPALRVRIRSQSFFMVVNEN